MYYDHFINIAGPIIHKGFLSHFCRQEIDVETNALQFDFFYSNLDMNLPGLRLKKHIEYQIRCSYDQDKICVFLTREIWILIKAPSFSIWDCCRWGKSKNCNIVHVSSDFVICTIKDQRGILTFWGGCAALNGKVMSRQRSCSHCAFGTKLYLADKPLSGWNQS